MIKISIRGLEVQGPYRVFSVNELTCLPHSIVDPPTLRHPKPNPSNRLSDHPTDLKSHHSLSSPMMLLVHQSQLITATGRELFGVGVTPLLRKEGSTT